MRRIITSLFFTGASLCFVTTAAAANNNAVTVQNLKSFNLNVGDHALLNQDTSPEICYPSPEFSLDSQQPSAGGENAANDLKLKPEFFYGKKDDDYNNRLDQYDTQVKLKVKVPLDINFE